MRQLPVQFSPLAPRRCPRVYLAGAAAMAACALLSPAARAVGVAQVSVHFNDLKNPNAPLLIGTSLDARSSFAHPLNPALNVGYYDPQTADPLPIGVQWETDWTQTSLRFPQGPVNVWNWKSTVGPIANRPVMPGVGQKIAFGIDEFMKSIAQSRVGVSPADVNWMVNIYGPGGFDNPNTAQAVQDAVDLVAYLNKKWDGTPFDGTNYEALRAENGRVEPYGVKGFSLGNEPWRDVEFDFHTADNPAGTNGAMAYAALASQFITAMRAVDSEVAIEIGVAGPSPTLSSTPTTEALAWNQILQDELLDGLDLIVTNVYYDSEQADQFKRGVQATGNFLDLVSQEIADRNVVNGTSVRQIIGEYGHALDQSFATNPPTSLENPDFLMQWQAAVATADFIAMISDSSANIERAHHFIWGNTISEWHPIRLDTSVAPPQYTVLPAAELFQLLGDFVLDHSVAVDVLSDVASDGETYSVQAGAFLSDDGLLASLMLINRDPNIGQIIDVSGLTNYDLLTARLLTGSGPTAESFTTTLLPFVGGQTQFTLPPQSILLLEFAGPGIVPEPSTGILLLLGSSLLLRRRVAPAHRPCFE